MWDTFCLCHFMVDHVDCSVPWATKFCVSFCAKIEDDDLLQYFDSKNEAVNPGKCDQWYNHMCVWSVYVCLVSFNGVMTCLGIPHTPQLDMMKSNNCHVGCSYLPIIELLYSDVLVCVCIHSVFTYMNVLLIYVYMIYIYIYTRSNQYTWLYL